MSRVLPLQKRLISSGRAVAAVAALAIVVAASPGVRCEDRVPGLTGIDRSDDVIQARQLLMDGIESEMMVIELGLEGKAPQLDDLKARADRISTLLTAADQHDGDACHMAGFRRLLRPRQEWGDDSLRRQSGRQCRPVQGAGKKAARCLRRLSCEVHACRAAVTTLSFWLRNVTCGEALRNN